MMSPKLNLSTPFSDAVFLSKARYVLASMTDNPNFPNPVPPLTALSDAIQAFNDAVVAANAGTHSMVAAKNERRQELTLVYVQLGLYVMYVAIGNVAIMVSSGYQLSKQREPVYISNPGNVTLTNGVTSGELQASVNPVKGSRLYLFQYADTEPNELTTWNAQTSTKKSYVFKGFTPGKKYWVRVAVTGPGEQIAYSTVASQYVL